MKTDFICLDNDKKLYVRLSHIVAIRETTRDGHLWIYTKDAGPILVKDACIEPFRKAIGK